MRSLVLSKAVSAGLIAITAVIPPLGAIGRWYDTALSDYQATIAAQRRDAADLHRHLAQARALHLDGSDVAEPATVNALNQAMTVAVGHDKAMTVEQVTPLNITAKAAERNAGEPSHYDCELTQATRLALASRDRHLLDQARRQAYGRINQARGVLRDSEGRVEDNNVRQALTRAIGQAEATVRGGDVTAIRDLDLTAPQTAVTASMRAHTARLEAEEAARAQAAVAHQAYGTTSSGTHTPDFAPRTYGYSSSQVPRRADHGNL